MSISADEVNYLIYRYLQENGFAHSAFTFAYESLVAKSSVAYTDVPPGALIAFLQKGLEYVGIEEHINEDGTIREFDSSTHSLLSPFICDAVAIKEDRRNRSSAASSSSDANVGSGQEHSGAENGNGSSGGDNVSAGTPPPSTVVVKSEGMGAKKWLSLQGHQGEVFMCTWNPNTKQLASGSADGVCRLWGLGDITQEHWNNVDSSIAIRSSILSHTMYPGEKFKDVTSVTWSPGGQYLATGCYDGTARIWTSHGELKHELKEHSGPVFSLKWNKSGTYLLSGSYDRRAIVWTLDTGVVIKTFLLHEAPVFDVDWKDDDKFATCSSDKTIMICSVANKDPTALTTLTGHADEVNAICWSPDGNFIASCSDDGVAKIWTERGLVHNLRGHSKEIYTLRWCPLAEGKPLKVCTASFDGSVKVWDASSGAEIYTLRRQAQPVYSVAPSPNGEFLAMGSLGGYVSVWNVRSGELTKEFRGNGDTFDVSWSTDGTMLCSCFSSGTLCIVDTST